MCTLEIPTRAAEWSPVTSSSPLSSSSSSSPFSSASSSSSSSSSAAFSGGPSRLGPFPFRRGLVAARVCASRSSVSWPGCASWPRGVVSSTDGLCLSSTSASASMSHTSRRPPQTPKMNELIASSVA
eukprot:GHVT01091235.1.p1 GENE.GHVT01091235.1~~GHVT01091235.1.p1  ORF type:complete len:127 (+),score=59.00 GHVT01091235.1:99-479(+)